MKLFKVKGGGILACDRHRRKLTELVEGEYLGGRIMFCRHCGKYWRVFGDELEIHERGKKLFLDERSLQRLKAVEG